MRAAALAAWSLGVEPPPVRGKLLRPRVALAGAAALGHTGADDAVRFGALALQMVHEASLLHDDIIDSATERRGVPTRAAEAGIGAALVEGDRLLTASYRVASATRSAAFLNRFIRSVEETVDGELAQARAAGRVLDPDEYRSIIERKSGALFGCALALAADLAGSPDADRIDRLGRDLGALYQMVDDLLDYCPDVEHGKPPLQDMRQRKWTWPLQFLDGDPLNADPAGVVRRLTRGGLEAPLRRALHALERRAAALVDELDAALGDVHDLEAVVDGWVEVCRRSLDQQLASSAGPVEANPRQRVVERAGVIATAQARGRYFRHHSESFSLAARLFPREARDVVSSVYAFCRFTDDLVDGREAPREQVEVELQAWLDLTRQAYGGSKTDVPLLDHVMRLTARRGVPLTYAEDLIEGVRSDLTVHRYATIAELDLYCYRVASVVGGWLTELFGTHDDAVLERAFALGRSMQLTNIVRDVGEDLDRGRIYLPAESMSRHDVSVEELHAFRTGIVPLSEGYACLLEEIMETAERGYRWAFEALPALPGFFARPVAVAARVYEGIHDAVRSNAYDNLTLRARTTLPRKVGLGVSALGELRSAHWSGGDESAVRAPVSPTTLSPTARSRARRARPRAAIGS